MYRVQTKTMDELRLFYSERDEAPDEQFDSTGPARFSYNTVPLDRLIEHYLNEHVPETWHLMSVSVDNGRVRLVWRDSDGR